MLFNSFYFLIFFITVFFLYWTFFNKRVFVRNIFILGVSYFFYACWDWRFLTLIVASSLTDYLVGIALQKQESLIIRRVLVGVSLLVNLGILFIFKYFNFFVESFQQHFSFLSFVENTETLSFIIPVGISFYTLQTLSYTFDVYRRVIPATKNIITFFAYVSFFPQLVAGPIERAKKLLPQFERKSVFTYEDGMVGVKYIAWGLFKKVVVAETLSPIVDSIFANPGEQTAGVLVVGVVFFIFQLYGDFSGYSDIAIGVSRLLGFRLMQNFRYPFFSRSISEYWRRWHISLTTWFRDYVYIPLGGNRVPKWRQIINLMIVFVLSGLWHGAGFNFVLWGLLSGILSIPVIFGFRKQLKTEESKVVAQNTIFPSIKELLQMISAFILFTFPAILFRSETVEGAWLYVKTMFLSRDMHVPLHIFYGVYVIIIVIAVEWIYRHRDYVFQSSGNQKIKMISLLVCTLLFTFLHFKTGMNEFIYFQF
jgi:D-alanyl-lipoteichoic acid acyltransferase DltB (MBOAT superfamily)